MSLEGTGGALDAVPEIEEINEIPYLEPNVQLPEEVPEVPDEGFDSSIESIKGSKDVEKITGAEVVKAEAVVDFTQEAIETAKGATGASNLFEEEEKELQLLENELAGLDEESEIPVPEEDPTKPVENQQVSDENKALSPNVTAEKPEEKIDTIVPTEDSEAESPQNRTINVHGVEITGLSEGEAVVTERAANVVYYSGEKAQSLEEVRELIAQLETLNAREFLDDDKFDKAVSVFMQESRYLQVNTPLVIENGAVDLETGKTTPIEIIVSEEERNSVTRPTPEQIKQAEKDMLETSHGRIMDMLAYLKDYEAVASGKMEPYHALMPKERLMELKRKSWFETKTNASAGDINEVVEGLSLTWEDTADLYESEGNSAAAEQIRATGRFEVSETIAGDYIVGEQHLRLVNISEHQQKFDSLLARLKPGDFVIVEHPSDPRRNAWTTLSSEIRFMQQAEKYPNENNGIGLEIMDDKNSTKWNAWENSQQEVGIDRNDFSYINGLLDASQRVFAEGGIEKLIADIQSNKELTEDDKKASLMGIQKFMQILMSDPEQSKQQLAEINRLRQLYIQLDSTCREQAYQERIASIKSANPGANLLVVVGNVHRGGLAETIENTEFRTEFNQTTVTEFQDLVEKIK